MEISLECPLCGQALNISQEHHHVLKETESKDGTLLVREPVVDLRVRSLSEICVHSGCWTTAERIVTPRHLDGKWLGLFMSHLSLLSPFMLKVPFQLSTGRLDHDVFVPVKDVEGPQPQPSSHFLRCPTEIIHKIFSYLNRDRDVFSFWEYLGKAPSPMQHREIGHRYQLRDDALMEISVPILLKNIFQSPAARYPYAANYIVVLENTQILVESVEKPLKPVPVPRNVRLSNAATLPETELSVRYAVLAQDVGFISLWFDSLGQFPSLCGIVLNGHLIGRLGSVQHAVRVKKLKGLHIAIIGDHIVAVRIKDMGGWLQSWCGVCPSEGNFTCLQWDSPQSELVVSHNHRQLTQVGYRNDTNQQCIYATNTAVDPSFSWAYLHDKHNPNHGLRPLQTLTTDFREVQGVNAYVNPLSGQFALTALEFVGRTGTTFLGLQSSPVVKLAFPLMQGEIFVGLSFGTSPGGGHLTITFITNLNRAVTFGEASTEILFSAANVAGISVGSSLLDHHLSVFGVLKSPKRPIVTMTGNNNSIHRQYWVTKAHLGIPYLPAQMVLSSAAPLAGITCMQAFYDRNRQSITGLMIYYYNRPPSILGELYEPLARHKLQSQCEIQGLKFSYSSFCGWVQIHFLELLTTQGIVSFGSQIPGCLQKQATRGDKKLLCWTFSHCTSYAQFIDTGSGCTPVLPMIPPGPA
ncbi:hypothetical protein AFLA70_559g000451 [Aspergillus flavus AF70]|nr:hypothetical protein AFLA70_559g000451 [Aspergillus flavus AF70]